MKVRPLLTALLAASVLCTLPAAEEPEAPRPSARDLLRARVAEDAKKRKLPPKPAVTTTATPQATPATSAANAPKAEEPTAPPIPTPIAAKGPAAKETPTVLPKVEVKKERITVLDFEIAKQEEAIARERKNLKTTETDLALNDLKVVKPLAIFGGESAQFRQRVAAERVELMEAEKDILEAMKRARTREEKAGLQKQLDELRTARRELDKTLR
ncbi:MAG: hypothetical protein Q8N18_16465 [Opitutaceae bacterium]|nr:hypothetical protein [Opitutaceae bacterium]